MAKAAFIFVGLLYICDARRARATAKPLRSSSIEDTLSLQRLTEQTSEPLNVFSKLLHAFDSGVAFRPSAALRIPTPSSNSEGLPRSATLSRVPNSVRLSTASQSEPDGFFAEGVRGQGRTLGIFALWASLIAYVALGAPGKDAVSSAADTELLNKLIANPFDTTVPPFFACVFNFMGLWPAWYACALLPGAAKQKPVPAAPFLLGSVAVGMFSLSPYLALREYREKDITQGDLNGLSRWTEGKLNAVFLSAGAAGLFYYGLTANDGNVAQSLDQYVELFRNSLFAHVTSLDFLSLWVLSYGVLAEDAKRRGMDCPSPLYASLPIVGHCAWLLLRPPLPDDEK